MFAGFVGNGVFTVILGPTLPALSAQWSLTNSQAGFFFTGQFLGSLLGVGAYSLLARRFGFRAALILGYALMGIGVAFLGAPSYRLAIFGIATAGFGYGLVTPASNLAVATGEPASRAALLNLLNFTWGIGAVSCPFLVGLAEHRHHLHFFFGGLTAALVLFALSFVIIEVPPAVSAAGSPGQHLRAPQTRTERKQRASLSRKLGTTLAIFIPLFFLYVGVETSFSGWVSSMAQEMSGLRGSLAALMPSFFLGTLVLGRASAAAILHVLTEKTVVLTGLALSFAGSLLWIGAHDTVVLAIGAALGGAGCSTIFPILVAWLTKFIDDSAAGWRSVAFAAASFGGAVLPKLVGVVATRFGGLRAGFPLVSLSIAVMILLTVLLHREPGGVPAGA